MAQLYTYQPLRTRSAVRLMKILPDKADDKVVCILHYFDQAEAPLYCAVSYVWGNSTPVGSIYLGENSNHIHFHPLHENLLRFLECMWEQKMFDKFFWTDSLCLNQNDKREKAHQVPRMGEIYVHAEDVLIWLGHESEREEKMRILQDWPSKVDWEVVDVSNDDEYDNAREIEETRMKEEIEESVKEATEYLLLLPYWRRVWIVQEVVLSKKASIACGNMSIDLESFRMKVDEFKSRPEFNYQPTIWTLCELRDRKGKKPLWELLTDFYLAVSTQTVDKVYGFLGLVAESEHEDSLGELIEVNYDKTVPEVYWDAIFECRAPWDQYSHVLFYMSHMAIDPKFDRVHWYITTLKDYVQSTRISDRHIFFAEITLRVFDAARLFVLQDTASFRDWRQGVGELVSDIKFPAGIYTEFQNAAAIGLVLSSVMEKEDENSSWLYSQGRQEILKKGWKCEIEQIEDVHPGFVPASDQTACSKFAFKLTTPVPESVSQSYLAKISTPVHFEIHGGPLKLIVLLDTEREPSKSWTISLNTNFGLHSSESGK